MTTKMLSPKDAAHPTLPVFPQAGCGITVHVDERCNGGHSTSCVTGSASGPSPLLHVSAREAPRAKPATDTMGHPLASNPREPKAVRQPEIGIIGWIASLYSHGKMRYEALDAIIEDAHVLLDPEYQEALQPVEFAYSWGTQVLSPIPQPEDTLLLNGDAPALVQWHPLRPPPGARDEVVAPFPQA